MWRGAMLGEPGQGGGFGGANLGGFPVGAGMGIGEVEVAGAVFLGLVGAGGCSTATTTGANRAHSRSRN